MSLCHRLVIATTLLLAIQQRLEAQSTAMTPSETDSAERKSESHFLTDYALDNVALVEFRGPSSGHHSASSCNSPVHCDDIGHCGRECVWTGDFPGSILVPGTSVSMKLGGYTKLDLIRDFDAIGNTDKFDTTTIPTDGTSDQNWRLHARQTRLNLDLRNHTAFGEIRGFVEGDFFGDSNALRLRHAYAEVGALLAGQTWSTFMDEATLPDILDYENPIGMMFDRRAMLRWTQPIHVVEGLEYSLAIEDPAPVFSNAAGNYEAALPDLVGRLRYEHDRFHFQVAGFASRGKFASDVGQRSDDNAWGTSLTGSIKVFEADRITLQYSWGDGIEGFRGFQRFALSPAGNLVAIPSKNAMITYLHHWSDSCRSSLVYANVDVDNVTQDGAALSSTDYASANIIWKADERIQMGLELLHGKREDQDSTSGEANRLQFAVWYFLP